MTRTQRVLARMTDYTAAGELVAGACIADLLVHKMLLERTSTATQEHYGMLRNITPAASLNVPSFCSAWCYGSKSVSNQQCCLSTGAHIQSAVLAPYVDIVQH